MARRSARGGEAPSAVPHSGSRAGGGAPWRAHAARFVIVVAAAVLPYLRLATAPLYPDAERAVTRNPVVAQGSFRDVVTHDFWGKKAGDAGATGSYRPVPSLTYWVQHRVSGPSPAAFHRFDLLLHAAGAGLVLLVLQRIVPRRPFALGGAVLFAAHPALSEAVCSVVGRCDLLAATSFLAAWLLHRHGRRAPRSAAWEAAALACLGVALLSKEYAVVFPILIVLSDLLLDRGAAPPQAGRGRWLRFALPAAGLVVAYLAARAAVLGSIGVVRMVVEADTPLATWSFVDRLTNAVWMLLPALRLLVVPTGLDHVYGIGTLPLARGPADPKFLAALAVVAAAAAYGARRWRRHADATPLVALGLVAVPLLPALNTVGVTVLLFAERFLYVPGIGIAVLAAWGLDRLARGATRRRVAVGIVVAVGVVFAALTARRVEDWRSNEALARAALRAHPHSAMALHELGMLQALRGQYDEAARLVRTSLDVQPTRPVVWRNYALVLDRLDRRAEAVDAWSRAVAATPPGQAPNRAWLQGLAAAQAAAGRSDQAMAVLARARAAHPGDARLRRDFAGSLLGGAESLHAEGRLVEAAALASRAVREADLEPGEATRAATILAAALAADAGASAPRLDLARALLVGGRRDEAVRVLEEGLRRREDAALRALLDQARH